MAQSFGNYILLRKLAAGGMAEVYLAKQTGLAGFERLVCVKRILPHLAEHTEFITMFLDEARIAAQLNHPNIVQIYELGEIDNSYFIAMELIRGEDVRHIYNAEVARGNPMPFEASAQIVHGALTGLDFAHRSNDMQGNPLNIVHRDISPQNVLVTYDGHVKVVDFGVAKARGKMNETKSGVLKGKYSYMSPEQANGQPIDSRSDIFAAGIILYEITTGTRLFKRENELETLHAVMECDIVPPAQVAPEYPKQLERIVMKSLAEDPDERYQTGGDMARALEEYLLSIGASPSSASLGAYMQDLFADKIVEDLFNPEDMDDIGSQPSGSIKASTRVSRSVRHRKRPKLRWSESSQVSSTSHVSRPNLSPSAADAAELLDSLPTAGLGGEDLAAATQIGLYRNDNTRSGVGRMGPESSLSRVLSTSSGGKTALSLWLIAALALGVAVTLMVVFFRPDHINDEGKGALIDNRRTEPIQILTVPSGAKVSFPTLPDDDPAVLEAAGAKTNFQLRTGLPKGTPIKVQLSMPGYFIKVYTLDPDDKTAVSSGIVVKLKRDPSQAGLAAVNLRSSPAGATVYIDDVSTGRTTPLLNYQLELGVHRFAFVHEGYHRKAISYEVTAKAPGNGEQQVHVVLVPLDPAQTADSTTESTAQAIKSPPDPVQAPKKTPETPAAPPQVAPKPTDTHGYVFLRTSIPYRVYQGRRELGQTPGRFKLHKGRQRLTLRSTKHNVSHTVKINVVANKTVERTVMHGQGDLMVNAVPYAEVWVANRKKQETPITFSKLISGEYTVRAKCPNGRNLSKPVLIKNGKRSSLTFSCLK